ncbi:RagB/SusD family nutrient uptake outer membrane protein [Psychroflexus halocasei]|uniref:Starch-binding associating with outer membrane n=1 Tax=Psychroflexus halocasei TaxID=908615 RepID=A0A1H3VHW5_9FLAO|nr:RagB/SusD family nutrient uptake outer membrane protein [Psychroflexus halocasei]SDZ74359.1 Starch-binding associating with outer membrane [Psychroflexus halocasei]
MKKIFKLNFVLLVFLAAVSCKDAYEVDPKDEVFEENAFNTVDQLEVGLYGVYSGIFSNNDSNLINYTSVFADDLRIASTNRGQGIQVHTWSINSGTTEPEAIWNSYYRVINRANRIMKAAEGIATEDADEQAKKDRIVAELHAIRGFAHFDLMRLFSQSYDPSAESVPIVDRVWVYEQPARNTVAEVTQFIKDDFDDAKDIFATLGASTDINRMSSIAVTALQARLALYTKDYDAAINFSTEVIDNSQIATTFNDYIGIWADEYTGETLWQLARTPGQETIGTIFTDTNGDVLFNVSDQLFDVLGNNNFDDDHRTFAIIDTQNFDPDNLMVGKYLGSESNPFLANIKMLRTSEQYLIRAEAYARTNQLTEASTDIETLRNARKDITVTVGFSDQQSALSAILTERRMELAFEGHRMFDLKRYDLGVVRDASDCANAAGACSLPEDDHRFVLPIPQSERFANDNMTQNQGY